MNVRLEDARTFLEAASEFVRLTTERRAAEAVVVRLARRLVNDATLPDEEAVRAAGPLAVRLVLAARGGEA